MNDRSHDVTSESKPCAELEVMSIESSCVVHRELHAEGERSDFIPGPSKGYLVVRLKGSLKLERVEVSQQLLVAIAEQIPKNPT